MDVSKVVGIAKISFNGKTHFIDNDGDTFCGTSADFKILYNDWYETSVRQLSINDVTCKRCVKKAKKEL